MYTQKSLSKLLNAIRHLTLKRDFCRRGCWQHASGPKRLHKMISANALTLLLYHFCCYWQLLVSI